MIKKTYIKNIKLLIFELTLLISDKMDLHPAVFLSVILRDDVYLFEYKHLSNLKAVLLSRTDIKRL